LNAARRFEILTQMTHHEPTPRKSCVYLFLISFVSLFLELLFIRWIPDSVHIISFFGNFMLLAIFLGLGIGLAIPLRDSQPDNLIRRILSNLFILSFVTALAGIFRFGVTFPGEFAFNEDFFFYQVRINIYLVVSFFVLLATYAFIPVGMLIQFYFRKLSPLAAYSINIGGSLAGIVFFSLLSYFGTPVWLWMAVALALILPLAGSKRMFMAISLALVAMILFADTYAETRLGIKKIWSPYYCLRFVEVDREHSFILIGNSFLLSGLKFYDSGDRFKVERHYYEFPYYFKKAPENVLVLGAGMGNDVAVALRMGARHVDAVEIDPKIIELGKQHHPEKPYLDSRVTLIADDARTFTRNTDRKYDLIVFGTLDSHNLFSQMSSIKMENFVYTLESFREAKKALREDGLLYINTGFADYPVILLRIYNTLTEVFGEKPMFFLNNKSISMYLSGGSRAQLEGLLQSVPQHDFRRRVIIDDTRIRQEFPESYILTTDDWPQMFLKQKMIPKEYLFSLGILFVVSAFFITFYFGKSGKFSPGYFFLGAGFMLLETKGITEMGLVFGTTWLVNSVVIASILLIILAVNLFLIRFERFEKILLMYLLLGISLLASFFFPVSSLGIESRMLKYLLAGLFVALPFVFAAFIFGMDFRKAGDQATVFLASNMLGAIFGGMVEYASMIYGIKSLYLFSLALYFIAMLAMTARRTAVAV